MLTMQKSFLSVFLCLLLLLFGPHPRAQLFTGTYHHLQPSESPLSLVLSHTSPRKAADSLGISKGIVPVWPTRTSGSRPSMEDKEWHTSLETDHGACTQLLIDTYRPNLWSDICKICTICKICKICITCIICIIYVPGTSSTTFNVHQNGSRWQ